MPSRDRPPLPGLDPADAFVPLDPPPGGLAALRARLRREQSPTRGGLRWTVTALAASAVVITFGLWSRSDPRPRLLDGAAPEDYPSLVGLGLAPLPAEPVAASGRAGAALRLRRVPVSSPSLVMYLAGPDSR